MKSKREKTIVAIKVFLGFFIGFIVSALSQMFWYHWNKNPEMAPYLALMQMAAGIPMIYADYIIYKIVPEKYKLFGKFAWRYIPVLHIIAIIFGIISTLLYPLLAQK